MAPDRRQKHRLAIEIAFLLIAALAVLALKLWVVGIAPISGAAMVPYLMPGDYLLVEKWPFTLGDATPRRGDVVVFRRDGQSDVSRVIGLPGDRVALESGRLILDGKRIPRWRVADLLVPLSAMPCPKPESQPEGPLLCRVTRLREMPDARFHDIIGAADAPDFASVTVPAGHLLLLGDNRAQSASTRPTSTLIPQEDILGRAGPILFSIDGRARLAQPGGWWESLRWGRIGARP